MRKRRRKIQASSNSIPHKEADQAGRSLLLLLRPGVRGRSPCEERIYTKYGSFRHILGEPTGKPSMNSTCCFPVGTDSECRKPRVSSGSWNKCLACGWGFDIFVIFHFRHERRKHSSAFVTKIFRSAVYNFRTKILRQKNLAPAD